MRKEAIVQIKSISELHKMMGAEKPKHPLICVLDASLIEVSKEEVGSKISYDFYMISLKDKSCGVEYGRNSFDFDEGVLAFSAPGQIYTTTKEIKKGEIEGWMLFFHPDLIRNSSLFKNIETYSFFNYDVYEALHLSSEEEEIINDCVGKLKREYEMPIDNHSQRVIVSNLELLLNYCLRYYERQFNTRINYNQDTVVQFERDLKFYFKQELHLKNGIPSIQYFSDKANLSQHYFSDLLKKHTGKTTKDHINSYLIEKAKGLLLSSNDTISEIAFDLGFNYPHYFTRLFKSKTGKTPLEFRNLN